MTPGSCRMRTILSSECEADVTSGVQQEDRPLMPSNGHQLGRRLRALAGVKEDLLAWVPHEMARYTALGGVVVSTAVVATVSMFFALQEILGHFSVWTLFVVLGWGLLVLNLDRWLVSSALGSQWHTRMAVFVPRLMLATLFGVIIAEPIVLRVFETAVEQHIQDSRTQQLAELRDQLVRCNQVPGSTEAPKADLMSQPCHGRLLTVPGNPDALANELSRLKPEAEELQKTINNDTAQLNMLNDNAQKECSGGKGSGFTGQTGYGRQCLDRLNVASQFAITHPIQQQQVQLAGLRTRIAELEERLSMSQSSYQDALNRAINSRVEEERAHQGPIGLLERFQALDELVSENGFLSGARWAVRLFFIIIDCLSVLTKMMGGVTRYDKLIDRFSSSRDRVSTVAFRATETAEVARWEKDQYLAEADARKEREHRDLDLLRRETEINRNRDNQVDLLAKLRLQQMRQPRAAGSTNGTNGIPSEPAVGDGSIDQRFRPER
jgi:Domain of unknown function (DUF4407)